MKNYQLNNSGDADTFIKSWKKQPEISNFHWNKNGPENQVQYAFQNHWEVFNEFLKHKAFNKGKKTLEVGCGRGSLSAYFANKGYNCSLLDISPEVIKFSRKHFEANNLKAKFYVGDANHLSFNNESFDVIFSIGLLEHFEKPDAIINEQIRVLTKGGIFIGYVVPYYEHNIQDDYEWVNNILKGYVSLNNKSMKKEKLYRSNYGSEYYLSILKKYKLKNIKSSGIYSLPMISHSTKFPFSIMPKKSEEALLTYFKKIMSINKRKSKLHPWLCKEGYGNAFVVWGYK